MRRIATGTTLISLSAALAACLVLMLAQFTPAVAQGGKYHEAPALAEQVKAGKLPPVEQRLPEQPLVVPVVEKVGEYGGVWRRAFLGPADANNYVRVVYDGLFRFSPDGAEIEPKIAAGAKSSADFKVWTILLRKGARWSDGAPFTADDIVFWYKDVLLNKDLTPIAAELDPQCRWNRRRRWRRSTTHGALHLRPAGDAVPDRGRQPGRRRPHLRDVPAGALPEEVPSRLHRQGGSRIAWRRPRASRPGPSCSCRAPRAAGEPRASDHGGVDAGEPGERSGVHAAAQSLLHRRRYGRATSCPISTRCASPTSPTSRR